MWGSSRWSFPANGLRLNNTMRTTGKRLPGVFFVTEPPPIDQALPRMDIAAFVGFAAAGPVDTPVPVEDMARFREIFREDVPLAWDDERGELQYSYLGRAVESFFRNGGVRCWVVRAAGNKAQTVRFPLAGVVPAPSDAGFPSGSSDRTAEIWARSAGTWAEALQVGTLLQRDRLTPVDPAFASESAPGPLELTEGTYRVHLLSSAVGLESGDLLRIHLPDRGPVVFLFVDRLQRDGAMLTAHASRVYWFRRQSEGSSPTSPSTPDEDADDRLVFIDRSTGEALLEDWRSRGAAAATPVVDRLRCQILTWREGRVDRRIGDLTFSSRHPRFWANLPSDADLFRLTEGRPTRQWSAEAARFRQQAGSPRFDLAGPPVNERKDDYLPLRMPRTLTESLASSAGPQAGPTADRMSPKQRDGIDVFEAGLFIDEDLAHIGAGMLLREAEHKHYTRRRPLPLRGLHSLLPVREVSLVATPDAVHRPWSLNARPVPAPLEAPVLDPVAGPDRYERYTLSWSAVPRAVRYRVQRSESPDFGQVSNHYVETLAEPGFDPEVSPESGPETALTLRLPFPCAVTQYFRVRSERYGQISAWSNTRGAVLPKPDFTGRHTPNPKTLELRLRRIGAGSPAEGETLAWESWSEDFVTVEAIDRYELQVSNDPGFLAVQRIPGIFGATRFQPEAPKDAVAYYRVRAWSSNTAGPWSNTVRRAPRLLSTHTLQPVRDYEAGVLQTIHRSLVRFCAARKDLLALLSLPRHFRTRETVDHVQALRAQAGAGVRAENELSYAALYHPWTAVNAELYGEMSGPAGAVRYDPPDGAIAGTMASLALAQGAWLAPANQPLTGALALDPDFTDGQWVQLSAARVNLVRRTARGFLVLGADTLEEKSEFRPISVRRLLSLLHRLALREGNRFVFESNDHQFRDAVRHQFEQVLSSMYVRGAFAGETPEAGFRVVTDQSVNTAGDIDRGRFIIELRVAPSRPLVFLTVRLVRTGPGLLEVREA